MISFVIPAHNEEAFIGRTLATLRASANALGEPYEIIVVNDASADATGAIAAARGARVVNVELRQIAAVRNAGARAAEGEVLFFIDADTLMPADTLRGAWRALQQGATAGGARVAFDTDKGLVARGFVNLWNTLARCFRWAAGCCVYVKREAFEAVGGFNESLFAAEEIALSEALHDLGPFTVLPLAVTTSSRKMDSHGMAPHLRVLLTVLATGGRALQQRDGLDIWYDGKREVDQ